MSTIPYCDDVLDRTVPVLQLVDVAKQLDLVITRVHQLLRDRRLLAIKRDRVPVVPEVFFDDTGAIAKGLPGLIAVLHDGGFTDEEILEWMFREDVTLPGGNAISALHTDAMREVIRRAQASAF
ncbi:Rv2175c family DNA-binding protein [Rhodococcus artemisiae]|uniref:Rv2175c family DNA-binding protein n=1 Tax=Rhodococcus artemisiae TaxID=714159 RepID=A0ABU7LE62_9NOCA|nr:Rv2175c family DNA-binding protein [Rhodococcus artemisiae]MEE2059839.1 Rv2175c family DNA-binding protein [Rhodococcus artemisiae]